MPTWSAWASGRRRHRRSRDCAACTPPTSTCRYHQTSPESHFTHNTVCSLATPAGRVTIRGRTMIVTSDGQRDERTLTDDALLDVFRQQFGIELDRLPPMA